MFFSCSNNSNYINSSFTNSLSDALVQICKEYHSKVYKLEGDKWDLERGIKIRILEVHTRVISALTLLNSLKAEIGLQS